MDQGRGKERRKKIRIFFILKKKRYEDQLDSKLEQQPFHGNGARKLVGYFNDAKYIRKRTDTVVAFTHEYSRVLYPQGTCVL